MSDQVWMAFLTLLFMQVIAPIVAHILNKNKLDEVKDEVKKEVVVTQEKVTAATTKIDHNIELSNSMLSKTTEHKENLEKKLETDYLTQIATANTRISELEKQLALLTSPHPPQIKKDQ